MIFAQSTFIYLFLPIVLLVYFILSGNKLRNRFLLAASLFFYAFGQPAAFPVILLSILANYAAGRLMTNKNKKIYLTLSVILNIGLLFVYKYLGYVLSLFGVKTEILSAAGISFFTFQSMSYVIDCYRDEKLIKKNILDLALYISFFPQLIAGPVVRYGDFGEQIENRTHTAEKTALGIRRFCFGFAKKIITANSAARMTDMIFSSDSNSVTLLASWTGALCYLIQIYYDFSGYSDMALGLGKIFGFDLPENFNYPFAASSISDFWRRWHITLSSWFRDYLYIPLGGNRKGKIRTVINKWIVFLCTGIWHGANLTFVLWGIIHGAAISVETMFCKKEKENKNIFFSVLHRLITLTIILLSFVIFRADSVTYAFSYIKGMFVPHENAALNAKVLMLADPLFIVTMVGGIVFSSPVTKILYEKASRINADAAEYISYIFASAAFVLSLLVLSEGGYNPFIYFRF